MRKILSAIYLLYAGFLFIFLMFIALPFVLIFTTVLKPLSGKQCGLFILRCWAWVFSLFSFFWVKTLNAKEINLSKQHIYVGNHGSYLDAIAVCISLPQPFSALGKIEMTRVPVFGWIYQRLVVMIDRSSKESRAASVQALKQELSAGQSILIFPEGTMNKSEQSLSEFYEGAFRIAIETKTPLQPFVMINNRRLLPRINPLRARPGIIKTIFLSVVKVDEYSLEDVDSLKEKVFDMMNQAINSNEN